ncbi:MAG: uridine kinase [Gemmatimonadaceae bacterium]|nr:uridine kinase [Gemmatimonadaceae bacterium]
MPHRPLMIGIAGGTGSGKTTVARRVAAALADSSVAFVEMDSYYRSHIGLTMRELHQLNWDHPDAFDIDLFVEHLDALSRGEPIEKPIYDYTIHARSADTVRVEKVDVVVLDGILLFTDERVRQRLDVKVFVDADADIRLVRRIRRDMATRGRPLEEILEQYVNTVRPMHLQFIEPSKRWADVIVPRGGHNTVAIEMILAKIRQRLAISGAPHIPMVTDELRRPVVATSGSHVAVEEHSA